MYRVAFLDSQGRAIPLVAIHMRIVNARRSYKNIVTVDYSDELNEYDRMAISFAEFIAIGNDGKTIDEVLEKYAKRPMVVSILTALKQLNVHGFASWCGQ